MWFCGDMCEDIWGVEDKVEVLLGWNKGLKTMR